MQVPSTMQQAERQKAYHLETMTLPAVPESKLREWEAFLERYPSDSPMHDPRWLRERFATELSRISVYLLYDGDALAGFACFILRDWSLKLQAGEITLARLPLRRLCLLGGGVSFPEDPRAYEALFSKLLSGGKSWDALFLEDVPLESLLWKFATDNPAITRSLTPYIPVKPAPRVLLRFEGRFEDYMGRFSSKHRKNLRRSQRLFEELAPGRSGPVRYTQPEQVGEYLAHGMGISRKTYQYNLLGLGLRSAEEDGRYLGFLARHGWLRSYLLMSGDKACAFMTGFQYGRRYFLDDMGYDPDWREHGVGKVLHLAAIEDLFSGNRPEVYDLGEYGAHKDELGTETCDQGKLLLFRPTMRNRLARLSHAACNRLTSAVATVLVRYGWKNRIKMLIRMWSSEA